MLATMFYWVYVHTDFPGPVVDFSVRSVSKAQNVAHTAKAKWKVSAYWKDESVEM